MKQPVLKACLTITLALLLGFAALWAGDGETLPPLKTRYMGETPPGMSPRVFGKGIVSTGVTEYAGSFSPDYRIFCFSRKQVDKGYYAIMEMRRRDGGTWSKPRIASFSGQYNEFDALFAPDGKLYYCSRRPLKGGPARSKDTDIWVVEPRKDGWSEPCHLGFPLNSTGEDYYPTLTVSGVVYFVSNRAGGLGGNDFYRAEPLPGGGYKQPENLGPGINTRLREGDGYISPDEGYFIFSAFVDKRGNRSDGELYISYRQKDGTWSKKRHLGAPINSPHGNEFTPLITPDGKFFFFATEKTGNNEIYWVDVKALGLVDK